MVTSAVNCNSRKKKWKKRCTLWLPRPLIATLGRKSGKRYANYNELGVCSMYVGMIRKSDVANGPGIRISMFVSGCRVHCKGCFQPETWNFEYGEPFTKELEDDLMEELAKPYYKGISILGGEPFEPENQRDLLPVIKRIKEELPNRSIWMYTGYTYDKDLVPGGRKYTEYTDEILKNVEILIDGQFMEKYKNLMLHYRGSENQRLIKVPETLENKEVVCYEPDENIKKFL